jgi:hypothetical protein
MASKEETEQTQKLRGTDASSEENGTHQTAGAERSEAKEKPPSRLMKIWASMELDFFTILLLAKGGLPPAIALGLYAHGSKLIQRYS